MATITAIIFIAAMFQTITTTQVFNSDSNSNSIIVIPKADEVLIFLIASLDLEF